MEESVKKVDNAEKSTVKTEPKKKGHGCLIAFLIFLAITIGLILFIYFRIKSVATSLGKQVDLGITYSQADYLTLLNKLETDKPLTPAEINTSSKNIDTTIIAREASAFIAQIAKEVDEVTIINPQVRFSNDLMEISTLINYKNQPIAIYISGIVRKASATTLTGDIEEIRVGNLRLPSFVYNLLESNLFTALNNSLNGKLNIEILNISNAGLRLKGTMPIN